MGAPGLHRMGRLDRAFPRRYCISVSFVTISYAQSIDGRLATSNGISQWISCEETLALAHELRRDNDAILVGINTVIADDPELSCRLPDCPSPVRVVFDSKLRLPLESKICRTADRYRTIVLTVSGDTEKAARLEGLGIDVRRTGNDGGRISLDDAVGLLKTASLETLFVEGGAGLITSFVRAGRVDRMLVVIAPLIIGSGIEAIGDLGIRDLADALKPVSADYRRLGSDLVWDLRFGTEKR